jgi:hypothetical protein
MKNRFAEMSSSRRDFLLGSAALLPNLMMQTVPLSALLVAEEAQAGDTTPLQVVRQRPLAPYFFGANVALYAGPKVTPEFLSLLASLNCRNWRWPSGDLANLWDWHKSAPVATPGTPAPPGWGFSLEALKQLVDQSQGVPILEPNMMTSNLQEQLAMLDHARQLGLPVQLVELGNEFFRHTPDYESTFPGPKEYAIQASAWAAAIKKKFPGVQVAAVANFDLGSPASTDRRSADWNATLFRYLSNVDAVAIHDYPDVNLLKAVGKRENPEFDSREDQRAQAQLLSDTNNVDRMFTTLLQNLTYNENVIAKIPPQYAIWMTEYNKNRALTQINGTWLHGLLFALMTASFVEDPRISLCSYYNIIGHSEYAALYMDEHEYDLVEGVNHKVKPLALTVIGQMSQILGRLFAGGTRATILKPAINAPGPNFKIIRVDGAGTKIAFINASKFGYLFDVRPYFQGNVNVTKFALPAMSRFTGLDDDPVPAPSQGPAPAAQGVPPYSLVLLEAA